MLDDPKTRKPWFENIDPPYRRIYGARLFRLLSTIRRFTSPQARRELGLSDIGARSPTWDITRHSKSERPSSRRAWGDVNRRIVLSSRNRRAP